MEDREVGVVDLDAEEAASEGGRASEAPSAAQIHRSTHFARNFCDQKRKPRDGQPTEYVEGDTRRVEWTTTHDVVPASAELGPKLREKNATHISHHLAVIVDSDISLGA